MAPRKSPYQPLRRASPRRAAGPALEGTAERPYTPPNDMPSSDADPPAELTIEDVRHLATLARLGMTDAELEKFRGELASIIGHCDVLQRVDTDGVEPTNNGADLLNVVAADEPRPPWPPGEVLANAPNRRDDLFRVRAVLE